MFFLLWQQCYIQKPVFHRALLHSPDLTSFLAPLLWHSVGPGRVDIDILLGKESLLFGLIIWPTLNLFISLCTMSVCGGFSNHKSMDINNCLEGSSYIHSFIKMLLVHSFLGYVASSMVGIFQIDITSLHSIPWHRQQIHLNYPLKSLATILQ